MQYYMPETIAKKQIQLVLDPYEKKTLSALYTCDRSQVLARPRPSAVSISPWRFFSREERSSRHKLRLENGIRRRRKKEWNIRGNNRD